MKFLQSNISTESGEVWNQKYLNWCSFSGLGSEITHIEWQFSEN